MLLMSYLRNHVCVSRVADLFVCFLLRVLGFRSHIEGLGSVLSSSVCGVSRHLSSFFCLWTSCCPSTIYWRDCSCPTELFVTFVEIQSAVRLWVYFWILKSVPVAYGSSFMSLPRCSDYCSFVVILKSGTVLFQDCFGLSGSLDFLYDFGNLSLSA